MVYMMIKYAYVCVCILQVSIDGSHINVVVPPTHQDEYLNRKLTHSIN